MAFVPSALLLGKFLSFLRLRIFLFFSPVADLFSVVVGCYSLENSVFDHKLSSRVRSAQSPFESSKVRLSQFFFGLFLYFLAG